MTRVHFAGYGFARLHAIAGMGKMFAAVKSYLIRNLKMEHGNGFNTGRLQVVCMLYMLWHGHASSCL